MSQDYREQSVSIFRLYQWTKSSLPELTSEPDPENKD